MQSQNHHYVPQWYQRRFLLPDRPDDRLFYRDLKPQTSRDGRGKIHTHPAVTRRATRSCFSEQDLYAAHLAGLTADEIERQFFGIVDSVGKDAVELFSNYEYTNQDERLFFGLLTYMGTQRLRTPRGLRWLGSQIGAPTREAALAGMMKLRELFRAVWMECVWQIADASESETKFILSDHPVTAYNRACGPRSRWCRGDNDPDITFHATHTLFPLSHDKILILTNQSWATNPYQSEVGVRPNPQMLRNAVFNFLEIQTQRRLREREVREINFILASRASRFLASAREDWLYPERYVEKGDWSNFGDGYLLMPDPRALNVGRRVFLGFDSGQTAAFDEYGRRPGEPGYGESGPEDRAALERFQGEFARLYGPRRRGRTWKMDGMEPEEYSDVQHRLYLEREQVGRQTLVRLRSRGRR